MTPEELLDTSYWIIDILPEQVPKDSPGQYFAVEDYFLREQMDTVKQKHINVILKLNCYRDISIDGCVNPNPAATAEILRAKYTFVMLGDSMILSEPDDTHMTLFNADDDLLELVTKISESEGLFVWKNESLYRGEHYEEEICIECLCSDAAMLMFLAVFGGSGRRGFCLQDGCERHGSGRGGQNSDCSVQPFVEKICHGIR